MSYTLFKQILIEQIIVKLVAIQIDGHQKWESFLEDNNSDWQFLLLGNQVFLITSY